MTIAIKAIAKLQPIVIDLKSYLVNPDTQCQKKELDQLPAGILVDATATYSRVLGIYNQCQQRIGDPDTVLLFGLAEVGEVANDDPIPEPSK